MTPDSKEDFRVEAWWRNSIGYIIYPAAYKDANGDGIGDLKGIVEKLDYLRELGIDLLWICPIFASPMKDNGYDVSDYLHVNPLFGTDEDLVTLLHEAHLRGIRVLLDFAMNHTSDQHEWFVKAKEDPSSEERSYYIIRKGRRDEKGNLLPPNNWGSFFSTSAWEKMPNSEDEFYLHVFAPSMPDTDWSNPKLRERYYQIARHYVDLGVDGFRMDAISHLAKNPTFEDSPLKAGKEGYVLDPTEFSNRPELLGYLKEFREKGVNENTLLVGEVGGCVQPEQARLFSERGRGPINLVFNFDTVWNNGAYGSIDKKDDEIKTDVISLKNNFMRWYENAATCDLPLYWCNHDHPRVLSQYGSVKYRAESAKMLVTTLLFLYGTPFIYQGDEIGMSNVTYDKAEDFLNDEANVDALKSMRSEGRDEETILRFWRRTNRINARTPMQWDKTSYAGFSKVAPKVKVNDNYKEGVNVQEQMEDPYSILNYFQYAISFRKNAIYNDIVNNGKLEIVDYNHPDVLAYLHRGSSTIMVISNFRPDQTYFTFNYEIGDIVLHNYDGVLLKDHVFTLRPFECYLLKIR